MLETFRGTRTLRYLWYEQRGLCTQCNTKITRITGWRLHYCVPCVKGGSTGAKNCVLLHPECHDRVHRESSRFETASALKRRSKGLSWVKGNLHAQF
jgi:RNA-directed DNA polymerase